jgi:DNA anti-recombination protein RmuC
MAAIEPRIQQLLSDQHSELQHQQAVHQRALAQLQEEVNQRIASVRDECRQKIAKMERTVKSRRAELQSMVDARMQAEGRQRIREEEAIVKKELQQILG